MDGAADLRPQLGNRKENDRGQSRNRVLYVACLDDAMEEELAQAPVTYENGRNDRWDQAPAETRYL